MFNAGESPGWALDGRPKPPPHVLPPVVCDFAHRTYKTAGRGRWLSRAHAGRGKSAGHGVSRQAPWASVPTPGCAAASLPALEAGRAPPSVQSLPAGPLEDCRRPPQARAARRAEHAGRRPGAGATARELLRPSVTSSPRVPGAGRLLLLALLPRSGRQSNPPREHDVGDKSV